MKFENSGTRDYTLTVDASSETRTKTGSFSTTQDIPPITISISNPSSGETINNYKTTIQYGFDSPEDFNYTVSVDGRQLESLSLLEGQGSSESTTANCLAQGQHNLDITATGEKTGTKTDKAYYFSTSEPEPIADMVVTNPRSGEKIGSGEQVPVAYSVLGCSSVNFEAYLIDDTGTKLQDVDQASVSAGQNYQPQAVSFTLQDTGDYSLVMNATDGSSSKSLERQFTVVN